MPVRDKTTQASRPAPPLSGRAFGGVPLDGPDDRGATMVEYGLLIGFIAMVVIVAVVVLGPMVESLYTGVFPAL